MLSQHVWNAHSLARGDAVQFNTVLGCVFRRGRFW